MNPVNPFNTVAAVGRTGSLLRVLDAAGSLKFTFMPLNAKNHWL